MGITPQENVAYLEAVLAKARMGASAAANAMAKYIAERTAQDTLTRNRHAPGAYHKARPGAPPSFASGQLANAMFWNRASASEGLRATAVVGNSDKRARLFEFGGCVLTPRSKPMLHWLDSGGFWSHHFLVVDNEHPFLGPTTDEARDDGSLHRVARDAFREYDP